MLFKMRSSGCGHRFHAADSRSDQFEKKRAAAGSIGIGRGIHATGLGNLADRGDAMTKTFRQALGDGARSVHAHLRRGAMLDHTPQPIDHAHAGPADRFGQVAEFQVRMGVHQARHECHVAQVFDGRNIGRVPDLNNATIRDRYERVFQRRAGYRKDPSGPQTARRSDAPHPAAHPAAPSIASVDRKAFCKSSSAVRASGNQVNHPSRARLATPPKR